MAQEKAESGVGNRSRCDEDDGKEWVRYDKQRLQRISCGIYSGFFALLGILDC